MNDDDAVLVCARADQEWTVSGSSFGRRCTKCKQRVMIAPSGQQKLREFRRITIVCSVCFLAAKLKQEFYLLHPITEEQVHELKQARRNRWRERN